MNKLKKGNRIPAVCNETAAYTAMSPARKN